MLTPLQQWFCDTCNEVIERPEQGWIEWLSSDRKEFGWRIVHHASASPRKPDDDCYPYGSRFRPKATEGAILSSHLHHSTGDNLIPFLLRFIDVGPLHAPDYTGPYARDLREWTELTRRLALPYYEEARFLWEDATDAGYFDGANEEWIYQPKNLANMITKFA